MSIHQLCLCLPLDAIMSDISENDYCSRYLNPALQPLFDDDVKNTQIRWSATVTANKRSSSLANRTPDCIITTLTNNNFSSSLGYGEAIALQAPLVNRLINLNTKDPKIRKIAMALSGGLPASRSLDPKNILNTGMTISQSKHPPLWLINRHQRLTSNIDPNSYVQGSTKETRLAIQSKTKNDIHPTTIPFLWQAAVDTLQTPNILATEHLESIFARRKTDETSKITLGSIMYWVWKAHWAHVFEQTPLEPEIWLPLLISMPAIPKTTVPIT
ncbi:hypothetical protein DM01DRAFT_326164 [Hesseltinella vesiculosa]|uniref:Uncharacterized protein n=1 Tax=Hesseltinella vesiculosa TaxID=101127 RepID=A0A1X2G303_9FUNG|nr:hypothetical protein DM01DRAFT_326164 [Hesseltinella vesiculosa]